MYHIDAKYNRGMAWHGAVEFRGRRLNRESLNLQPRPSYAHPNASMCHNVQSKVQVYFIISSLES